MNDLPEPVDLEGLEVGDICLCATEAGRIEVATIVSIYPDGMEGQDLGLTNLKQLFEAVEKLFPGREDEILDELFLGCAFEVKIRSSGAIVRFHEIATLEPQPETGDCSFDGDDTWRLYSSNAHYQAASAWERIYKMTDSIDGIDIQEGEQWSWEDMVGFPLEIDRDFCNKLELLINALNKKG